MESLKSFYDRVMKTKKGPGLYDVEREIHMFELCYDGDCANCNMENYCVKEFKKYELTKAKQIEEDMTHFINNKYDKYEKYY